jgi:hypothetical protein
LEIERTIGWYMTLLIYITFIPKPIWLSLVIFSLNLLNLPLPYYNFFLPILILFLILLMFFVFIVIRLEMTKKSSSTTNKSVEDRDKNHFRGILNYFCLTFWRWSGLKITFIEGDWCRRLFYYSNSNKDQKSNLSQYTILTFKNNNK